MRNREKLQDFVAWTRLVPNRPRYAMLCNFDEFRVYDFDTGLDTPKDALALQDFTMSTTQRRQARAGSHGQRKRPAGFSPVDEGWAPVLCKVGRDGCLRCRAVQFGFAFFSCFTKSPSWVLSGAAFTAFSPT